MPSNRWLVSASRRRFGDIHAKLVNEHSTIVGSRRDQHRSGKLDQGNGDPKLAKLAIADPEREPHQPPEHERNGGDATQTFVDFSYVAAEAGSFGVIQGNAAKEPCADGKD